MKKITKKVVALAFLPLSALLFFSCDGVIFDSIRDEVELEDAQISGDVNSIVRFKDDIFVQNGNIWKKSATLESAHGWEKTGKPSADADYTYVNKLAADSTYLYAQMTLLDEDHDEGEIVTKGTRLFYSEDGNSWNGPIEFENSKGETISQFTSSYAILFCTNAVQSEHRKAYFRIRDSTDESYAVYELNGESATKLETKSSDESSGFDHSTTPVYNSKSCAYFGGKTYFSTGYAMATDETAEEEATTLYYSSSGSVFYSTDGENFTEVATGASSILSLACTKNYLYLGTSSGIEHSPFETDSDGKPTRVPKAQTDDFDTNADSTLSSYYEVRAVLVLSSDSVEKDSTIYGSASFSGSTSSTSATQDNVGLWAYYASRGSWNRE